MKKRIVFALGLAFVVIGGCGDGRLREVEAPRSWEARLPEPILEVRP